MIFADFGYRAYADATAELCEALIAGYADLPDERARFKARILNAVTQQVHLQAELNDQGGLELCTEAEREVLLGPRHLQPRVGQWECAIPLVLVDVYYEPYGEIPRPVAAAETGDDGRLIWLSPMTEDAYLRSLAQAGALDLADLEAARAGDAGA
jgi:hypothetical protein